MNCVRRVCYNRPKQSLGQNFLSDPNISRLIAEKLTDTSPGGVGVIEVGPGTGSITRFLYPKFPKMTGTSIHGAVSIRRFT